MITCFVTVLIIIYLCLIICLMVLPKEEAEDKATISFSLLLSVVSMVLISAIILESIKPDIIYIESYKVLPNKVIYTTNLGDITTKEMIYSVGDTLFSIPENQRIENK